MGRNDAADLTGVNGGPHMPEAEAAVLRRRRLLAQRAPRCLQGRLPTLRIPVIEHAHDMSIRDPDVGTDSVVMPAGERPVTGLRHR